MSYSSSRRDPDQIDYPETIDDALESAGHSLGKAEAELKRENIDWDAYWEYWNDFRESSQQIDDLFISWKEEVVQQFTPRKNKKFKRR